MVALRDQWLSAHKVRRQEVRQRQDKVRTSISHYRELRQQGAVVLRQSLSDHHESVRVETSLFLTQAKQQRLARQATTRQMLADHSQARAVARQQQQQDLVRYVDDLRMSVADYLTDISEDRRVMAVQQHIQRHQDREALTVAVASIRNDHRVFHANLRQAVWGDAAHGVASVVAEKSSQQAIAATQPSNNERTPKKPQAQSAASAAAPQAVVSEAATKQSSISNEEAVFELLENNLQGLRLTEIEATLGISRFQAVDALRSLIQKNLIVQNDRTYYVQEEATL